MKKLLPVIVAALVMLEQCFFFCTVAQAADTDIVITEIAAYESAGCEWVELYNRGAEPVVLEGWRFWEAGVNHGLRISSSSRDQDWIVGSGEYVIIAQDDDMLFTVCGDEYVPAAHTVFDSSWGSLNESGELIGLRNSLGESVEDFTYPSAGEASLERVDVTVSAGDNANWQQRGEGNSFGRMNEPNELSQPTNEPTNTSTARVLINEFVPNPAVGGEWVELYNLESVAATVDGWGIYDGRGMVSGLSGTITANGFFIVSIVGSQLNNAGDRIEIRDENGVTVDAVSYGSWDDGNLLDNAPVPGSGEAVARKLPGQDLNRDIDDFALTATITMGETNAISAPAATQTPVLVTPAPPATQNGGAALKPSFAIGSVLINEIVSQPVDGEEEWIELFNTSQYSIDLADWWIEDGSESKTLLSGSLFSGGLVVVREPNGNMNNKGDTLALFDPSGKEIDRVTYGVWDDGRAHNHATAPGEGQSLARHLDQRGVGDDDKTYFAITSVLTPGQANTIEGKTSEKELPRPIGVRLSELFPNPRGVDTAAEWIEIENTLPVPQAVTGWSLSDDSGKRYVFPEVIISANSFAVFDRSVTGIALNNSGNETVRLNDAERRVVDEVSYSGTVHEDTAYGRGGDGGWQWGRVATKNAQNIFDPRLMPPVIQVAVDRDVGVGEKVQFDASDTTDPDGDSFEMLWDFGDGTRGAGLDPEHAYAVAGRYDVVVTATDATGAVSEEELQVMVRLPGEFVGGDLPLEELIITEVLPNPNRTEEDEFVEIYNAGAATVDMNGWKIDDGDGGSRAHTIRENVIIDPGEYVVFGRKKTKLAFNNTADSVRLYDSQDRLVSEVDYGGVIAGASFARLPDGIWQWTTAVTPGAATVISVPAARATTARKTQKKTVVAEIRLEQMDNYEAGDRVRVRGVVAVLPGVFGSQYFYIVPTSTSDAPGVQVFMAKKLFPVLTVGDVVTVAGEISDVTAGRRIKVAATSDIVVVASGQLSRPATTTVADAIERLPGSLVHIHGDITEIKKSYAYIDDGTDEIKVYFKAGARVRSSMWQLGDSVGVSGVIAKTNSGVQLWPRGQEDVTIIENKSVLAVENNTSNATVFETYLTATAGGITTIVIGFLARARAAFGLQLLRKIISLIARAKK